MDGDIYMQEYKIDWKSVENEEELNAELARFRERNGIGFAKPTYQDYRWSDEKLSRYKERLRRGEKSISRQIFYLADQGDIGQNTRIINAVVYLKQRHFIPQTELDRILTYKPPLLRLEIMEETEPGSAVFRKKIFDLVHIAIECGSKSVLERLLPHIDFAVYDRVRVMKIIEE